MKRQYDGVVTWDKCDCGCDSVGLQSRAIFITPEGMLSIFTGRKVRVTIEDIETTEPVKDLELVMSYA